MKFRLFFLFLLLLNVKWLAAQDFVMVQPSDFESVLGLHTGSLTYLDYTTNETITMDLVGVIYRKGDKLILEHHLFEWRDAYDQKYVYKIKNGTIDGWNVEEQVGPDANGNFRLLMTRSGKDGNERKPCTFRLTFEYQDGRFSIIKDVRFEGESSFFNRNRYDLNLYRNQQNFGLN